MIRVRVAANKAFGSALRIGGSGVCVSCSVGPGQRALSFEASEAAEPSVYRHGRHRSDAEKLISTVPVIEVAGYTAVCDGGGGALGHPIEYIQLNKVSDEPAVCKYCGLRFQKKAGSHHH